MKCRIKQPLQGDLFEANLLEATPLKQPLQSDLFEVTSIAHLDLLDVLRGQEIKLIHTVSNLEV